MASTGVASPGVENAGAVSVSVIAVVVAYNRRDLMLEALAALKAQTASLTAVVLVDNHSDDDSADAATQFWPEIDVVRLPRNTGGAGGFASGLAVALLRYEPDWIWLMDDDTVPQPTALERLLAAADRPGVVLAGSRVVWTDGADHPMNTPRTKPFARRSELHAASQGGVTAVRSSSFVSMLVAADRVREAGLPIADYFIWNDDFEFSTRMLRGGRGLYVPSSVVVHKTRARVSTDADPGARFYYEVRNKVWLMMFSHGLNPLEKVVYLASTVLRWARTVRKSKNRRFLLVQLRRGLIAGMGARPRRNADVLAGLGVVSDEVVQVEALRRRSA
ncbi:glycosyltransferase family 2 protein [uncultured Amnibacterium sp.]|uniref:glycosyltransferase family 2 protein n=1 Tax=uncultured Amnibacterium sp. TaxID=1631851 RepID=UPI0035CC5DC9